MIFISLVCGLAYRKSQFAFWEKAECKAQWAQVDL